MSDDLSPQAVAVLIKVPGDRANKKIQFSLQLLNPDGHPVKLPLLDGTTTPIVQEGQIEVGRPPGIAEGSMLNASIAVSIPPKPIDPAATSGDCTSVIKLSTSRLLSESRDDGNR